MSLQLGRSVPFPIGAVVLLAALWLLPALACGSGPLAPANTPAPTAPHEAAAASPTPPPATVAPPTAVALPTVTPAPAVDLRGRYAVAGTNFDGSSYSGQAVISGGEGVYNIEWQIGSGVQVGAGTLSGDSFSVRWRSDADGTRGGAEYTLQPDGSLSGTWTIDGATGQGTETLTPLAQ